MRLLREASGFLFAALCSLGILVLGSGCDSLGLGDDPPKVTVSAELTAADKTSLNGCEITFQKNGSTEAVQSCSAEKTYQKAENTTVEISGQANTYEPTKETVTLSADRSVNLNLSPDSVSVTLTAKDADPDTSVAGDFYIDGTLVAENTSKTTTQVRKANSPVSGRVEVPYFTEDSRRFEFTPDRNRDVAVGLERKSVNVSVRLETSAPEADLSSADVTIYEPAKKDSVSCTGRECMKNLPKRSGQRSVQVTNRDTHPKTGDIRRYDPYTETFAADEDRSLSAELSALAACNDGISNDIKTDGDTLVDVWKDTDGDGSPSKGDVGDPGCVSKQDDHEGHRVLTLTSTRFNDNLSVSPENEKELIIDASGNSSLESSVQDAVGDLTVTIENKRAGSGEFKLEFNTGPKNDLDTKNSSQVVAYSDTIDGWHFARVYGVDKTFFPTGVFYTITAVHTSGEEISFLVDGGEGRSTSMSYAYQQEDDPNYNKNALAQDRREVCEMIGGVQLCRQVSSNGYLY